MLLLCSTDYFSVLRYRRDSASLVILSHYTDELPEDALLHER